MTDPALVTEVIDWAVANGLLMQTKADGLFEHAPVSIGPIPFPQQQVHICIKLMKKCLLYMNISYERPKIIKYSVSLYVYKFKPLVLLISIVTFILYFDSHELKQYISNPQPQQNQQ